MWIGCGYPKSGTVWLCQLMSSYLDIPYPQNYMSPIAMRAVVHAHWKYDERLPRTVYVVRDGRDVMVSFYYYRMKALDGHRSPAAASKLNKTYKSLFGASFDPADIRSNLPRFIEHEMEHPSWAPMNWPDHVSQWLAAPPDQVAVVRYEDLLDDVVAALSPAFEQLTGSPSDDDYLAVAKHRFDFQRKAGRERGQEDTSSFMRKGIAGDWRAHFSPEATDVFNHYAGTTLKLAGYDEELR